MYKDYVIPLTKEAEVRYLLQRLGNNAIAYHGPDGGMCHKAALQTSTPGTASSPYFVSCANVAGVFEAVLSNKAFYGVAIFQQGGNGPSATMRALLRESPLRIVGEVFEESSFRLVARVPLNDVRRVRGRPDALRLCGTWLKRQLAHLVDVEEVNCADDQPPWTGVLSSTEHECTAYLCDTHTALDSSLRVTVDVGKDLCEHTRCVVLSKRSGNLVPTTHEKTIVLFGLKDKAGALAQAINVFQRHGVNINSINSNHDQQVRGQFNFLVELQGHTKTPTVGRALEELVQSAEFMKVLGSFTSPRQ